MTSETELQASVTVTINLIPFGEARVITVTESARELEPTKGLYVFPSQTARVEPLSLTNNDVQVL